MSPRSRTSAGIVLVRRGRAGRPEILLVHPGGPFWARKDLGAWSIPKGEHTPDEDPVAVARREFTEELGVACPAAELHDVGEIVQAGGKRVHAFAGVGDVDTAAVVSNTFEIEWPPRSGRMQTFPEVDRAEWFPLDAALEKVVPGQRDLLERAVGQAVEHDWFARPPER